MTFTSRRNGARRPDGESGFIGDIEFAHELAVFHSIGGVDALHASLNLEVSSFMGKLFEFKHQPIAITIQAADYVFSLYEHMKISIRLRLSFREVSFYNFLIIVRSAVVRA